uniref:Uncharacterized protein n=1 Tax=Pseudopediastrum sp. CL0201VA TaxID=2184484 RepID=A0A2U8GJX4_9CHLO|nr:hypothetical protein [Pseudopediastrum sp. CL0201VA]AWI68915.1 hypothetical protein [Pseudopediastrum sp. CL0201VA]
MPNQRAEEPKSHNEAPMTIFDSLLLVLLFGIFDSFAPRDPRHLRLMTHFIIPKEERRRKKTKEDERRQKKTTNKEANQKKSIKYSQRQLSLISEDANRSKNGIYNKDKQKKAHLRYQILTTIFN